MTRTSPSRNLIALSDIPPAWPLVERAEMLRIGEWIRDPRAPGALWIHGPPGSGRTTAAAAAIRRSAPAAGLSAFRVAAHPELALEEALDDIGGFLRQLGCARLERALSQRSLTRSKTAVLLEVLRETPWILWVDDADALAAGRRGLRGEVSRFLHGCAALEEGAGRVLIVSSLPPPPGTMASVTFAALSPAESRSLWGAAGGIGAAPPCAALPLEVVLLARASRLGGAGEMEPAAGEEPGGIVRRVVDLAESRLGKDALAVLRAAASLPPSASRKALREALGAEGMEFDLAGAAGSPLRTLADLGLVDLGGENAPENPPLAIHNAVRRAVLEGMQARDPGAWKRLRRAAARHSLGKAARTGSIWPLVSAWRSLMDADLADDAHDVQKVFVQELVRRGHFELAQEVLEDTARTATGLARAVALGNLAIIHKNSGDHDRALEIYRQVHAEFERLGDEANTARVLHQIGNTRYLQGDHGGALESYRKSLETSSVLGDRAVSGATRIQIANILYQNGELAEALAAYEECLSESLAGGDAGLIAAVEIQVGRIHFLEGRYLEAEAHLGEAEARAAAGGDLRSLLKVYEAQADLARKLRDYDAARGRCDRAVDAAASLGDALEGVAALVRTGDLERERLHLAEAVALYDRSLGLVRAAAARGDASGEELDAIAGRIEARLRSLEETVGTEAFARIARERKCL